MDWTDTNKDTLRVLWAKGHSASEIARLMGARTKNMIIGKVRRMALPARPNPVPPKDESHAVQAPLRAPRETLPPLPSALADPPPMAPRQPALRTWTSEREAVVRALWADTETADILDRVNALPGRPVPNDLAVMRQANVWGLRRSAAFMARLMAKRVKAMCAAPRSPGQMKAFMGLAKTGNVWSQSTTALFENPEWEPPVRRLPRIPRAEIISVSVIGAARTCQWPTVEGSAIKDWQFCGAASVSGRSWCAVHMPVVFRVAA